MKDWGCLDEENKQTNEDFLNNLDDLYLIAAYETCKGKIYIITNKISENAGNNVTVVLFQVRDDAADCVDCLENLRQYVVLER